MVYHELFLGDAPTDFPKQSVFLAAASCGKRLYMLNESLVVATTTDNVPILLRTVSTYEYDMAVDEITEFRIDFADEETSAKTIGFYMLQTGFHGVILTYDNEHGLVNQYRMHVDRANATMEIECIRRFTFRVICAHPGGITRSTGYIALSGRTPDDDGGVYVVRLFAADPDQAARFPDIRLDKQLAELESLLRTRELYVQISYPMLNQRGIYFWTFKLDESIPYEFGIIGALEYNRSKRAFEAKMIKTSLAPNLFAGETRKTVDVREMNALAQTTDICYMSSFTPAPRTHWRWKLQALGMALARIIRCVGVRVAMLGGPRWLIAYVRFYLWLFPNVVPNWKPTPSHRLLALNMRSWSLSGVEYNEPHESTLQSSGLLDFEATSNGDSFVIELPLSNNVLRIGYVQNPFQPPSLLRAATLRSALGDKCSSKKRSPSYGLSWSDFTLVAFEAVLLK